ncbi:MAG: hypothetical protein AB7V56_16535 [Candidatus Nitrosocosmicus sp.]|nr:hypothetical protein [Candidatus Nitrosocosmicus sp. SS]
MSSYNPIIIDNGRITGLSNSLMDSGYTKCQQEDSFNVSIQ